MQGLYRWNHSQKYQGDESRQKKVNSKSIKASKLQITWHTATRHQRKNRPEFLLLAAADFRFVNGQCHL